MPQVWSATQINPHITGGGTTTATYTLTTDRTLAIVYADTGVSSGKYYWEARITTGDPNDLLNGVIGYGVGNTSSSIDNNRWAGDAADSVGPYLVADGAVVAWYVNNTEQVSYSLGITVADGDLFGFALDLVNNTLWFRDVTQNSGWFGGSVGGNPAINTNGFSLVQTGFTITSLPVVPGGSLVGNGDTLVGYFSPASWTGAAPAGFLGFDAAITPISGNYAGRGVLAANRAVVLERSASRYSGAGAFTATSTISHPVSALLAAFAGSGTIATSSRLLVPSSAAFPGSGSFFAAPLGRLTGGARFAGTGSLNAALTVSGHSDISAAFSGAASLTLRRLTALTRVSAAYSGAGAVSGDVTVLPRTTITTTNVVDELGNQIVDQLGNILVTEFQPASVLIANFSGIGSLAVSSTTLLTSGLATYFFGAGSFVADLAQHAAAVPGSASFSGAGSFSASGPNLLVSGLATYFGAGNLRADLAQHSVAVPSSGSFSGGGSFSVSGPNRLISGLATYLGAGNFGGNLTQHLAAVPDSASFSGGGSFSVSRPTLLSNGLAKYSGAGNFGANLTQHLAAVPVAASFSGGGSFSARVVARLTGNARFSGVGVWSTGQTLPTVLARCFGLDIGLFLPPTTRDAPRAGPATASDAALDTAPSLWLKDAQAYFAAGSDAARGLAATSDAASGKATPSDVQANSIVVSEL